MDVHDDVESRRDATRPEVFGDLGGGTVEGMEYAAAIMLNLGAHLLSNKSIRVIIEIDQETGRFTWRKELKMESKMELILSKAENVILQEMEKYEREEGKLTDKEVYSLQLMVITMGRIRNIREGGGRELYPMPG